MSGRLGTFAGSTRLTVVLDEVSESGPGGVPSDEFECFEAPGVSGDGGIVVRCDDLLLESSVNRYIDCSTVFNDTIRLREVLRFLDQVAFDAPVALRPASPDVG